MTSLRCALYQLPSSSRGNTIFDAFNRLPPVDEYSDYMYWDNTKIDYVVASSNIILGSNNFTADRHLYTVAIGYATGNISQGTGAISIGYDSGRYKQQQNAIAIGYQCGHTGQQHNAIAIGYQSGYFNQQSNAVAVGYQAGVNNQGTNAVAIGYKSGQTGQGSNSIAIGYSNPSNQSIALNSTTTLLTTTTPGFFVKSPIIRGPAGLTNMLSYNSSTGEIFYNSSSKRYKYDIQPTTLQTEHIYQVTPKEFKYNIDDTTDVGFIAEEMAEIEPKFVYNDKDNNPEVICWNVITLSLIEEMKKLAKRRDILKKEIQELKEYI